MKNLILLFSLLSFSLSAYAQSPLCSSDEQSFCETSQSFSNQNIFMGKIVAIDTNGIDFEIIDILRGTESRPVIRIWDGTDFECNGTFSMAAADLGDLNDSMVLILPMIGQIMNTWDVVGDYRRPEYFGHSTKLNVKNNFVKGLINGGPGGFPPQFNLWVLGYEAFKKSWEDHGDCSDFVVGTKELAREKLVTQYNNPIHSELNLNFTSSNDQRTVSIYSIQGQLLNTYQSNAPSFDIDFSNFANGFYLIKIQEEKQYVETLKVLKL